MTPVESALDASFARIKVRLFTNSEIFAYILPSTESWTMEGAEPTIFPSRAIYTPEIVSTVFLIFTDTPSEDGLMTMKDQLEFASA